MSGPKPKTSNYSGHDRCHNFALYAWCYCVCRRCYRPEGHTVDGLAKGTCICDDCPCRQERALAARRAVPMNPEPGLPPTRGEYRSVFGAR